MRLRTGVYNYSVNIPLTHKANSASKDTKATVVKKNKDLIKSNTLVIYLISLFK